MRLQAVEVETLIPLPELHARVRAVRPRVRPGARYLEAMNQAVEGVRRIPVRAWADPRSGHGNNVVSEVWAQQCSSNRQSPRSALMVRGVEIVVDGEPAPQGSMKPVVARNGRAYVIHNAGDKLSRYRSRIRREIALQHPGVYFDEPVRVTYRFYLKRPKRPRWRVPAVKPDLDKLVRAVNDAITGLSKRENLLREDSRIVSVASEKRYVTGTGVPRTHILIEAIDDTYET